MKCALRPLVDTDRAVRQPAQNHDPKKRVLCYFEVDTLYMTLESVLFPSMCWTGLFSPALLQVSSPTLLRIRPECGGRKMTAH